MIENTKEIAFKLFYEMRIIKQETNWKRDTNFEEGRKENLCIEGELMCTNRIGKSVKKILPSSTPEVGMCDMITEDEYILDKFHR